MKRQAEDMSNQPITLAIYLPYLFKNDITLIGYFLTIWIRKGKETERQITSESAEHMGRQKLFLQQSLEEGNGKSLKEERGGANKRKHHSIIQ